MTRFEKVTMIGYLICRMLANNAGDYYENKACKNKEAVKFKIKNDKLIIREVTNL